MSKYKQIFSNDDRFRSTSSLRMERRDSLSSDSTLHFSSSSFTTNTLPFPRLGYQTSMTLPSAAALLSCYLQVTPTSLPTQSMLRHGPLPHAAASMRAARTLSLLQIRAPIWSRSWSCADGNLSQVQPDHLRTRRRHRTPPNSPLLDPNCPLECIPSPRSPDPSRAHSTTPKLPNRPSKKQTNMCHETIRSSFVRIRSTTLQGFLSKERDPTFLPLPFASFSTVYVPKQRAQRDERCQCYQRRSLSHQKHALLSFHFP